MKRIELEALKFGNTRIISQGLIDSLPIHDLQALLDHELQGMVIQLKGYIYGRKSRVIRHYKLCPVTWFDHLLHDWRWLQKVFGPPEYRKEIVNVTMYDIHLDDQKAKLYRSIEEFGVYEREDFRLGVDE